MVERRRDKRRGDPTRRESRPSTERPTTEFQSTEHEATHHESTHHQPVQPRTAPDEPALDPSGQRRSRPRPPDSSDEGDGIAETGRELMHDARDKVEEVGRETGRELRDAAESRKTRTADTMERVARAIRRTADSLEEEDAEQLGEYTERAADRIDQVSDYVRRNDLGTMLSDTERFARRRPEIFFGGLALAGLAAGRFLRSSTPSGRRGRGGTAHGGSYSLEGHTPDRERYGATRPMSHGPGPAVSPGMEGSSHLGVPDWSDEPRSPEREGGRHEHP